VRISPANERELSIVTRDGVELAGTLAVPANAPGLVIFAHGSGSTRKSPRNRFVAEVLHQKRFATLLMDLLSADEDVIDRRTSQFRFDITHLAERLVDATLFVRSLPEIVRIRVGYFGASTGAAAALVAAARIPEDVDAIVSRGGRPDLANGALGFVRAPSLLIVGADDPEVLRLNRLAMRAMRVQVELAIVEGATHLFEEPGMLQRAAELARDWFMRYLGGRER
jgi:putative phosphoribosyl transferase